MRVNTGWAGGFGTLNVAVATALVAMPAVVAAGFWSERGAPPAAAPSVLRGTFEGEAGVTGPGRGTEPKAPTPRSHLT